MTDNFENFQNERNILLRPDVQNDMLILMGGQKEKTRDLTKEQQNQITKNYVAMYFSLAAVNWCQGTTLGIAWQKALEQMDSFIKAKIKVENHPMTKWLAKIHSRHHREMSKEIMTNQNANNKISMSPESAKKWSAFSAKHFEENKNSLNGLYNQLMPQQKVQQQSENNPFKMAIDKISKTMQTIMLQQKLQNQMG